jgi:hypothetical protein
MLLSNITAYAGVCNTLIELSVPVINHPSIPGGVYAPLSRSGTSPKPDISPDAKELNIKAISLLLHSFVDSAAIPSNETRPLRKGNLHFLASVFANVTTVKHFLNQA